MGICLGGRKGRWEDHSKRDRGGVDRRIWQRRKDGRKKEDGRRMNIGGDGMQAKEKGNGGRVGIRGLIWAE